jgi:hypothetical protein
VWSLEGLRRCTLRFAPTVAKNARFHLNPVWTGRCTVQDAGRRGEEKEKLEACQAKQERRKLSREREKEAIAQEADGQRGTEGRGSLLCPSVRYAKK